ncbi:MAG: peptidoglycan-binding protein [Eubacteriales bacterium]|nr:peptidoglycan-binding protein [Eubacteriales bacterium]
MSKYNLGALPSLPDERDYSVCAVPMAFPDKFILDMDKNYDQAHGTCVAQSARGIYRENFGIEFGTAFLYGGGRSHTMAGMYPNEAANFAIKYGLAPIEADPDELEVQGVISYYKTNRPHLEASAKPFAGGKWGRCHTVNEIKSAITDGLPVMFCAPISQWNPDKYHRYPCKSAVYGHHEMLIVGWDRVQGEDMAVVYNSWGVEWGNRGECYMSWEDVLRLDDVIALTPPPKKEPENDERNIIVRRTLKKGMTGNDVTELQQLLIDCGFRCDMGEPDGKFGSNTDSAVRMYQDSRGLTVDGIVGAKTWAALDMEEVDELEADGFEPTGLMAEFIYYLETQYQNCSIYVWGAQGQRHPEITEAWIKRMETSSNNAKRAITYWREAVNAGYGELLRAFDCSGLGMYFIQNLHGLSDCDRNAEGMRKFCKEITRKELRTGDWVFRVDEDGAYHIGYVVDNEKRIIHARGRDYGVVSEYLNDNGSTYWNWYGRPTIFDADPEKRDLKLQTPYLKGDDVHALQETLLILGYAEIGTADGVYGPKTDAALRNFQTRAKGMTDGVCDSVMRGLLGL